MLCVSPTTPHCVVLIGLGITDEAFSLHATRYEAGPSHGITDEAFYLHATSYEAGSLQFSHLAIVTGR